jgi:hypothetical protein
MIFSNLTNSIIFQRGRATTKQILFEPRQVSSHIKSWSPIIHHQNFSLAGDPDKLDIIRPIHCFWTKGSIGFLTIFGLYNPTTHHHVWFRFLKPTFLGVNPLLTINFCSGMQFLRVNPYPSTPDVPRYSRPPGYARPVSKPWHWRMKQGRMRWVCVFSRWHW